MKSAAKTAQLDPTKRSDEAIQFLNGMRRRVVGQDPAIEKVAEIYQMFLAGFAPPGRPVGNLLFLGPTGSGKCLAPGTPVLMHNGSIRNVEDVRVGDMLMGPDSKPRKVLSLAHGFDEMYDIVPVKGDSYRVNKPHVLSLVKTNSGKRYRNGKRTEDNKSTSDGVIINIPVDEYLFKTKTFKHSMKGYRVGVEFADQPVPVDPYFLGLWLGDGTSKWAEITSDDVEIIEAVYITAAAAGMEVSMYDTGMPHKATRYNINTGSRGKQINRPKNLVLEGLRSLGVLENKHIPLVYKANSRKNRLELLAGLFDSDGSPKPTHHCDYISKDKQLADDLAFVARSVGLAAYVRSCQKTCQTGTGGGTYYRVSISGDLSVVPTHVARKIILNSRKQKKSVLRTGIAVKPAGYGEYFGFELDGDGLFLLGDFTVTHNTRVIEAMAEVLFNDPRAMIKVDCAEFQHSHEIAKLIGSPPGYLGHRETHPMITQEQLAVHHTADLKLSLLLFDEIEKSSDALWQLLLGVLDKATLTLGDNRRVDLSQTIIFLTSNLGAADMQSLQEGRGIGFGGPTIVMNEDFDQKMQRTAAEAVKRKFTPEFLNRIDKTVVFRTLRVDHLKEILDIELGMVQERIYSGTTAQAFLIRVEQQAKEALLMEGTDTKYGARHLKRAIERNIVHPLANLVATSQVNSGDVVQIGYEGDLPARGEAPVAGEYTFSKKQDGAILPPPSPIIAPGKAVKP